MMSANFILSNTGVPQSVLSDRQSVTPRTRAISACSTQGIPVASHYHPSFSQSYPPLSMVDGTWNPAQQGVYVNGLGKFINVFPGSALSEVDDIALNQPGESYKYANLKLPGVGPQPGGGHLYAPQSNFSCTAHGTLPTQFALAAAPNAVAQPQNSPSSMAGSVRAEAPNIVHPSAAPHQTSTPAQPLFVPGPVGQQTVPHHHQSSVSPPVFPDGARVSSNLHPIAPCGVKPLSSLNCTSAGRVVPSQLSNTQQPTLHPNYSPNLSLAQHPALSHHHHQQQLYSTGDIHSAPYSQLCSALTGNMIEFLPPMFTTDPSAQAAQINQTPAPIFGQFPTQLPTTYEPTPINVDIPLNTRVRHNTWSGLETHISGSVDRPFTTERAISIGNASTELLQNDSQQINANELFRPSFASASQAYAINQTSSFQPTGTHRPGLIELPSVTISDRGLPHQLRDLSVYNTPNAPFPRVLKTESPANKNPHWNASTQRVQPLWSTHSHMEGSFHDPVTMANNGVLRSCYNTNTTSIQQRYTSYVHMTKGTLGKGRDGNAADGHLIDPPHTLRTGPPRLRGAHSSQNQFGTSSQVNYQKMCSVRPPSNVKHSQAQSVGLAVSNLNPSNSESPWNSQFAVLRNDGTFGFPSHAAVPPNQGAWHHQTYQYLTPHTFFNPKFQFQSAPFLKFSDPPRSFTSRTSDSVPNVISKTNDLRSILDAFPMRMLVSTALVGAVIGRGGRTIRLITSKTGALVDFRPETIAFCQFSFSRGVRNVIPPSKAIDHSTGEQAEATKHCPTEPVLSHTSEDLPSPDHQYSRSQVVFLSGSREQCSAALTEILAVCFRESEHKGLSAPCLGILVPSHIYTQLLMGQGHKYFSAIHAATGARVTVTGSAVCSQSDGYNLSPKLSGEATANRILVVRGHLAAICAAEVYISEQMRFTIAEFLVTPIAWPLLPFLSIEAPKLSTAHSKHNSHDWGALQTINKFMLSVANVFWPHSICSKLMKHPSFDGAYQRLIHALFQLNTRDCVQKKIEEKLIDHTVLKTTDTENTEVKDGASLRGLTTASVEDDSSQLTSFSSPPTCAVQREQSSATAEVPRVGDNCHDLNLSEPLNPGNLSNSKSTENCTKPSQLTEPSQIDSVEANITVPTTNMPLVTSIQKSLVTVMGSSAWLATSGVLYVLVSYNEAGVLIGAGGYHIQQLMQSTGAEVYVNKAPIKGPFALSQALSQPFQPEVSVHPVHSNVPATPECVDSEDLEESGSTVEVADHTCTPRPVVEHSSTCEDTPEHLDVMCVEQEFNLASVTRDSSDATQPRSNESVAQNDSNAATTEKLTPVDFTTQTGSPSMNTMPYEKIRPTNASYRLVVLSGPLHCQMMALWRIFQRLKFIHQRGASSEFRASEGTETEIKIPMSKRSPTSLRLATLVCLPCRFVCWLTSNNSGFADFMSTCSTVSTQSGVSSCVTSTEASTPLQWLEAQASGHTSDDGGSVRVIHLLPEPRRRRRLMQQQLRRAGLNQWGPQFGDDDVRPIVLPPVDLTHVGLDLFWSDPNRVPLEIFADYETTQLVLGHLHHMLTLWLYGQALVSPNNLESTQVPPLPLVPHLSFRPHFTDHSLNHFNYHNHMFMYRSNEMPSLRFMPEYWSYPWTGPANFPHGRGQPGRPTMTAVRMHHTPGYCPKDGRTLRSRGPVHSNRWYSPPFDGALRSGNQVPAHFDLTGSYSSDQSRGLHPINPFPAPGFPSWSHLMGTHESYLPIADFVSNLAESYQHNKTNTAHHWISGTTSRFTRPWSPASPWKRDCAVFNTSNDPPRRQFGGVNRPHRKTTGNNITRMATSHIQDSGHSAAVEPEKPSVPVEED